MPAPPPSSPQPPDLEADSAPLTPGLLVLHGNHPEQLRDLVLAFLARQPLAPLEDELVLVQSNGVAQWLKLALAQPPARGGHGVAAAVQMLLPSRFQWQVYRTVLGEAAVPAESPFDKPLLVWRLMRLLPALLAPGGGGRGGRSDGSDGSEGGSGVGGAADGGDDAAVYAPLAGFLADDTDRRKRFQLAQRLADLLDQYQVYRADWLADWAAGRDQLRTSRRGVRPVPEGQRWQPRLWRALLADVAATHPLAAHSSRAEVHARFLQAMAALPPGQRPPGLTGFPRRVLVFGVSSMPQQTLEVLAAVARCAQVLMAVHNPCEHDWSQAVADQDLLRAERRRRRPRPGAAGLAAQPEALRHTQVQPLLAAWGKQGRDFIALLDAHQAAHEAAHEEGREAADGANRAARHESDHEHDHEPDREHHHGAAPADAQDKGQGPRPLPGQGTGTDRAWALAPGLRTDCFDPNPGDTLLRQLQDDIRDLRPLAETRSRWPAVDPAHDRSLRLHIAHSPQREVEVLHDALLAALADDPTLRPRDIVVMVPDIAAYAPHVQAVFGLLPEDDPRHIPFTLADQAAAQDDPLLAAVAQLLGLPQARVAASELLALLEVPAVRRRFGIAEDQLPLLRRWVHHARIRWGLHSGQQAALGLPADAAAANTWDAGLQRLLLGYAAGEEAEPDPFDGPAWPDLAPVAEPGGLDAVLLGPLSQLLHTLARHWRALRQPATPAQWAQRLHALLADCFAADDGRDGPAPDAATARARRREGLSLLRLGDALDQWAQACAQAALDEPLPLSVVREHWLAALDDGGLQQPFIGGGVVFATLMPMRAIPFRMVALLGMHDGAYPRQRRPPDFDLMADDWRPGDRSRREDDRYLFLEALLSARDRLHISWVGRAVHDDSARAPSVLVAQLCDHLAAGWRLAMPGGGAGAGTGPAADRDHDHDGPAASACDDAARAAAGQALVQALTVVHRLQPFHADYFTCGQDARLVSYAGEWRAALAQAEDAAGPLAVPAAGPGPALPHWLPEGPVALATLAEVLREPVRAFLRLRLRTTLAEHDDAADDTEPLALDGLARWQHQAELIRAQADVLARGGSVAQAQQCQQRVLDRLARRGALPAGAFGPLAQAMLAEPLPRLLDDWARLLAAWPLALPPQPLHLPLRLLPPAADADPRLVVDDWLDHLRGRPDGQRVRLVLDNRALLQKSDTGRPGRQRAWRRELLAQHWLPHLAAQLCVASALPAAQLCVASAVPAAQLGAAPAVPAAPVGVDSAPPAGPEAAPAGLCSIVVSPHGTAVLGPLDAEAAAAAWQAVGEAYQAALQAPLPFHLRTASTWWDARRDARQAKAAPDASRSSRASGSPGGVAGVGGTGGPGLGPGGVGSDAWRKAQRAYEGGEGPHGPVGERERQPAMARAWPSFDALWADGAFAVWAERLLAPMDAALLRGDARRAALGLDAGPEGGA